MRIARWCIVVGAFALSFLMAGCVDEAGAKTLLGVWEDADHNLWTFRQGGVWNYSYRPIAAPQQHSQGTWTTVSATGSSVEIDVAGAITGRYEWSFASGGAEAAVYDESGAPRFWSRVPGA